MPELPEVETMRRGLAVVVGRRIAAVEFPRGSVRPLLVRPRPAAIAARLAGRSIVAAERRGKRVVLAIADPPAAPDAWLVIEPRMTGLVLLVDPPSVDHVRLVMHLEPSLPAAATPRRRAPPSRVIMWDRRGLGTIRLVDRPGLEAACGSRVLGPDGLVVAGADLAARLGRSRRAVKVALLDQRAVAGIGNIYASEILHRVGVDPRVACRRLPRARWDDIARATRDVLREAVRLQGSSIGDRTYRTVLSRPGRFQARHRVYGREDAPCEACGTPVRRIVQAQRSTFYCPACQVSRGGLRGRVAADGPAA